MKVGELKQNDMQIEDGISVEEASAKLMRGEDFEWSIINAILYHYGFYDEEAVCVDRGCTGCRFNGVGAVGCIAASSKYARELIANKFVRRKSIEMMI